MTRYRMVYQVTIDVDAETWWEAVDMATRALVGPWWRRILLRRRIRYICCATLKSPKGEE
jgi:hypothetical protein